jgi:predicted RNA-binding protein with PIN domain
MTFFSKGSSELEIREMARTYKRLGHYGVFKARKVKGGWIINVDKLNKKRGFFPKENETAETYIKKLVNNRRRK